MKETAVIVGAGPGGGAAAIRLAQLGIRKILLVDKDRFPREKTCGSALSPNALATLDGLGLGGQVAERGYRIHSLRVITPGRREMRLTTGQAAVILLRKHFDNMLVEEAQRLGVEFRPGFRVTELLREGGRVVGVRGGADEIRADYVIAADGAHSIFSTDPRPKQTISTLMGWWEGLPFEPRTIEMYFDRQLSPLYGWLFPENAERVNIGICIEGTGSPKRNVREVFAQFLDDYFRDRLPRARQIGRLKGHPISYTTWIKSCSGDGILYLGEAARMTHNATGEGIYQAMQSGVYAAEALAAVLGGAAERHTFERYAWRCRQRFTVGFMMGHVLRGALKTPMLDSLALAYNSPLVRRAATWALGSVLAGSAVSEEAPSRIGAGASA